MFNENLCKNFSHLSFEDVSFIVTQICYNTDLSSEHHKSIVVGLIVLRGCRKSK